MTAKQGHMNECRLLRMIRRQEWGVAFCVKQLPGCEELQHEARDIFSLSLDDDQKILWSAPDKEFGLKKSGNFGRNPI